MEKLGVSVTVLPGSEIFPALEKGVIDAIKSAASKSNNGTQRCSSFSKKPGKKLLKNNLPKIPFLKKSGPT